MRPALLVIIMDFLVSSLLLFIGNGEGPEFDSSAPAAVDVVSAASAATLIATYEDEWRTEYQQFYKDYQLTIQRKQLDLWSTRNREWSVEKNQLELRLKSRESELARQQERAHSLSQDLATVQSQQVSNQIELAVVRNTARQRSREKESLSETNAQLLQSVSLLSRDKQNLEQEARELAAQKAAIQDQARALHSRVAAQTETISRQSETIANQQQTIGLTLKDMATVQTRVDSRTAAMQLNQQQLIQDMQTFAEKLPQELRASVNRLAEDQRRVEGAITGLVALTESLAKTGTPADQHVLIDSLEQLSGQSVALHDSMKTLITQSTNAAESIQVVRQQQDALKDRLGILVEKVDVMETRHSGPFSKVRQSRVALTITLKASRDRTDDSALNAERVFSATVYAPLLTVSNRCYLVCHARDVGLLWYGILQDLQSVDWRIEMPGSNAPSIRLTGDVLLPRTEPLIVLVDCGPESEFRDTMNRAHLTPMQLIGPGAMDKRGPKDCFLFKRSAEGLGFAVETAPNFERPDQLVIRRTFRPWLNFLASNLLSNPGTRPEAGDYLVTADGLLIGLMLDTEKTLVLDAQVLQREPRRLPLNDVKTFEREAIDWRRSIK